jgi:hypothetical protein
VIDQFLKQSDIEPRAQAQHELGNVIRASHAPGLVIECEQEAIRPGERHVGQIVQAGFQSLNPL